MNVSAGSGLAAAHEGIVVVPADPGRDAVDGVVPGAVAEPATPEALAAALAWASSRGAHVVIRGSGSKTGWGRRPDRVDLLLSTRRLNRILDHRYGDLTATVEAGVTLAHLNDTLAEHGQCLPLDPPFAAAATIGGLLATNDSGPLRHRFGTPRDLVIGIQLATTDGRLAKSGGQVVKNVAGYDLSKLVSGSFGGLAAITAATFKLSPLPKASATLQVSAASAADLAAFVTAVSVTQLEPLAFDVRATSAPPSYSCLLRFASVPAAVAAQIDAARALASADLRADALEGDSERRAWETHADQFWSEPGAVARASWLPSRLGEALAAVRALGPAPSVEFIARAALGSGHFRVNGDVQAQAAAIRQLRKSALFGNVVIVRGPTELKQLVDVWGPAGDRARLFAGLKQALDPRGILNAGRGPI